MIGSAALACGALAACATTPDGSTGGGYGYARRSNTLQDDPQRAPRTAEYALAAIFPSGMLDAVLVTLATLSLTQDTEHDDDFLSAFGRRILSGRSAN
jgi:hypothetical protein